MIQTNITKKMKPPTNYRRMFLFVCLFIIVASLTGTFFYIMNARMSAYPYDTAVDYNYDFRGTDSKIIDLHLKKGKFSPPLIGDGSYSAFLKININTTFMGKFLQPEVELSAFCQPKSQLAINKAGISEKVIISEYFENGAKGIRYINISPLLSSFPSEIELKGTRVLFKDQPIQVILFKNKDITNSKILIIAPHPDDAEIAAFGLYSSLSLPNRANFSGNSKNIYVITVTAGDAGTYQYDEIYSNRKNHFLKKGRIRTWNSITVPLLAGIPADNVLNLGFFDGTLQNMFELNPAPVKALYTGISNIKIFRRQNISPLVNILEGEANWESLVRNLENLLNAIQPDIIVAPYPALDRHPDHKFSSIALFEAIKRAFISNREKKNGYYEKQENENIVFQINKLAIPVAPPPMESGQGVGQNNYIETYSHENHESYDIRRGYLYLYTNHFVLNEYYPYGEMGGVISLPPAFKGMSYAKNSEEMNVEPDSAKDNIYFKSIYSHLLSPDRQREKILSLEAMNDLRPDTSWRFSADAVKMAYSSIQRDIMGKNVSYYRRSVRNNELFFVVPVSDIYNKSVMNRVVGEIAE